MIIPDLNEVIAAKLDATAHRVRKILVLRGLTVTVAVFLAVTMLAMAADAYFVIFDDAVRYSISTAVWAATVTALFFAIWIPLRHPVSRRSAAKALDERHPENEERLTTVVEIIERAEQGDINTSPALFSSLMREGAICAHRIDVVKDFTARTIVRRLKLLGVIAVLLGLSFLVFPSVTGLLFVRAALPWIDVGNLYGDYLTVTPGSVAVLKGATVEIKAELVKKLPGEMMIRISRKTDGKWGKEFAEPLPAAGYRETADLEQREWRYRVSCGPAVTKYYTVRVCEMPKYRQFTATLDYPDYTGRPPFTYTNEAVGAIHAIEGTRVTFRLDIDEPGTTGELRLSNAKGMNQLSDTGTIVGEMVSNHVASWSMELTSRDGFKSPKRGGPFVSVQDQRPTVVIESPKTRLKLPTHAKLPITFTATDDIGVGSVAVRYKVDEDSMSELRKETLAGNETLLKRVEEVDLSCFNLLGARQMRVELVVFDRYPESRGGPHSVTSTPVFVDFEQSAVSFAEQSLQEQAKESEQALLEAEKRLETAERQAREAREQLRRQQDKKITEQAEKHIENLAHEVAEAEKRAEELAEKLEEDGKFDPVAQQLRAFAQDEMAPVAKKVEEAQFADANERAKALEQVQPMLREAREKMKEAEAELKDRAKELATHEKTRDLADRQEALAAAAKAIMDEKPVDTKKLEAWKRMEEAAAKVAADLAKQDDAPELDDARRKMAAAADEMSRLKAETDIANDKRLDDAQKASAQAKLAESEEKAKASALKQAVQAEKSAVDALQKAVERREAAAKTEDANQKNRLNAEAASFEKTAAQQQSAAEDQLMKADAPAAAEAAQQKASDALEEASAPEADHLQELKEALAAQREALAQVDENSPLPEGQSPVSAAAEQAAEAAKRQEVAEALQHLEAAERAEEQALDALRDHDAEAAAKAQETAASEQKAARAAHAANALEAAEKSEAAAQAATDRAKQYKNDNEFRNALKKQAEALEDIRESVDALKEALGAEASDLAEQRRLEAEADRIRNAQIAAERSDEQALEALKRNDRGATARELEEASDRMDRAKGLMEAQRAAAERRDDAAAVEALESAIEAQAAAEAAQASADAAQEKAFQTKKDEDRAAAEQAIAAAQAAQAEAGAKMQAAAEKMEKGAQGQEGLEGQKSQDQKSQGQNSQSQKSQDQNSQEQGAGGQHPDETAKAAAEDVQKAAARQAAKLGLKAEGKDASNQDPESAGAKGPEDTKDPSANSRGGKNAKGSKESKNALSGGGIRKELEKMARELKSKEAIPAALLDKVSSKAWFRIRGSVKEGLGERDLKDIPAEYRELVRRYFLRLVETE